MNYKAQYNTQKSSAKLRNIDWHFTYESWLGWWGTDIINRGRKAGQLVMARIGDQGAYDPDNCVKKDCGSNVREAVRNYDKSWFKHSEVTKKHLSDKLKGRVDSEETKLKKSVSMSASHANRKILKEPIWQNS